MSPTPSHFRTVETADFPCPHGILKHVTVKSPALAARSDASLYLPEMTGRPEQLPVVILLHGVYGSHWAWAGLGQAHLTLQAMIDAGEIPPMILAMPSDGLWGDGSAYLRHKGGDFESWIVDDVPKLVTEITGNAADSPLFIAGLSMGGYGALRLGASHPERFTAFAGHSSITRFSELARFVEEPPAAYGSVDEEESSVIAAMLRQPDKLPPFRFDCGTEDSLIDANRELHRQLREAGIACEYAEHPGGHEWAYWVRHIAETFRFFGGQLH